MGFHWLLERWQEYRALLDRHVKWDEPVLLRFFRLQGKEVVEAAFNGPLNALFLAWDVLVPDYAKEAWKFFRDDWPMSHPADSYWLNFREIADRPAGAAEAWGLLYGIVNRHVERLTKLLAERLDLESVPYPDWTDRRDGPEPGVRAAPAVPVGQDAGAAADDRGVLQVAESFRRRPGR